MKFVTYFKYNEAVSTKTKPCAVYRGLLNWLHDQNFSIVLNVIDLQILALFSSTC